MSRRIRMAYWNMQSPLEKDAPAPSDVATDYVKTWPVVSSNTIPHHAAVESAEDGEKAGRHSFPLVGSKG
jgi:hypothetical protein